MKMKSPGAGRRRRQAPTCFLMTSVACIIQRGGNPWFRASRMACSRVTLRVQLRGQKGTEHRFLLRQKNKVETIKLHSSTDIADTFADSTSSASSLIPPVVFSHFSSRGSRWRLKTKFSAEKNRQKTKMLPDCRKAQIGWIASTLVKLPMRVFSLSFDNLSLSLCSHPH